jgi:arylsulfatase A-like enzyme
MSTDLRVRCGAALLLFASAAVACGQNAPRHAVLITVDTLRADRIGAYGYAAARTPNLDRFAREAVRFERAYAHSSKTLPSVATLMTGQLPGRHGLHTNLGRLPDGWPTLAERMRAAGFDTAAFIGNYALRSDRDVDRGFDTYTREFRASESNRPQPENRGSDLTDSAIAWLDGIEDAARAFLWVHYQEPHGPYTPPSFDAPSRPGPTLPVNRSNSGVAGIPRYQWLGHGRLAEYSARYDGEIREVDTQVGRLLDALREAGISQSAAVIITADHGEAFGESDLYCAHGEGLDDALLRVPLLLKWPGADAQVRSDTVRLIDVAPTLLELMGLEADALQGASLLRDLGDRRVVAQVSATRGRHWRRVWDDSGDVRELRGAPPQFEPLDGAKSDRPRLSAVLAEAAPWSADDASTGPNLSEQERKNLEALGYVD